MDALAFTPWFGNLLAALTALTGFAACWRWGLRLVRESRRQRGVAVSAIDRCLPQTQCGQCGFAGCAPYAEAIASGAAINKCPPGGERTIRLLAELLQEPIIALDPAHGTIKPPLVALIREPECIGCTKCIQACPVDATLGAPRLMHTVIASECTGCELCVAPCPVDCIELVAPPGEFIPGWLPAIQVTGLGSATNTEKSA